MKMAKHRNERKFKGTHVVYLLTAAQIPHPSSMNIAFVPPQTCRNPPTQKLKHNKPAGIERIVVFFFHSH